MLRSAAYENPSRAFAIALPLQCRINSWRRVLDSIRRYTFYLVIPDTFSASFFYLFDHAHLLERNLTVVESKGMLLGES